MNEQDQTFYNAEAEHREPFTWFPYDDIDRRLKAQPVDIAKIRKARVAWMLEKVSKRQVRRVQSRLP